MEYKMDLEKQENELRSDPLAALLRENRPQPTGESRAQVLQTLHRIETPPWKHPGIFIRRAPFAFAAACLVLLLLTTGTAYAISSWLHRDDYKPGNYIGTPSEQRTEASYIPDVEKLVRDAAPQSERCRIVMLPEMEDVAALNEWRVKMGQPEYNEADWAWVREIRPEIQEVLYDGSTFAYTIRLNTDHAEAFSSETHGTQWLDACTEHTIYADSDQVIGTIHGQTNLMEETLDAHGITLNTSENLSEPLQGNGRIFVTAEISVMDANVDSMAHVGLLGSIYYTFSFDVDGALKAADASTQTAERTLSGNAVLTLDYDTMWNMPVSLDGVVLEETVSCRSTGVYLSYRVKEAPENWTEQMKKSLLSPTNERGKFEGMSVSYTLGGDATVYEPPFPEITVLEDGSFAYTVILPFFPSDYEMLKQQGVTVHLTLHAVDSFNGEPVDAAWQAIFPENGFDLTTSYQPLISFPLELP
mgnify:CR=1 FL=1